jgi:hypothetical protein
MFIKITKSKNNEYVRLVESHRENGKTKHKTLLNLGRLEEIQNNPSISKLNSKRIRDKGYGYILASRIRKMGKSVQDQILTDSSIGLNPGLKAIS